MGGGYEIGVSGSSSSGANQSGAVSQEGGSNIGGQSYGPGSLFLGTPSAQSSNSPLTKILIAAGVVVALVLLVPLFRK